MGWPTLFAQVRDRSEFTFRDPYIVWGTAGIAGALLVGAFALWLLERWRKKANEKREAIEELTDFRTMYERGEITDDEYAKLRDQVAKRVKEPPPGPPAGGATGTTGEITPPPGPPPPAQPPPPPGTQGGGP